MLRFLFSALILVAATAAQAGMEGYIQNGQEHIVYKDGKKVGDWPTVSSEQREPSSGTATAYPQPITVLYFVDDTTVNIRCYVMTKKPGYAVSEPLACARTQ